MGPTCLAICLLATVCCAPSPAARETRVVRSAGRGVALFRNSHSTALAQLAAYHGLRKPREADRTLIATCWMYAQYCECDKPGRPMVWRLAEGLRRITTARGYPHTAIQERCLRSPDAAERAGFSDLSGAIDRDHPVLVSFCYDPAAAKGLALAKRRETKCFSALAIGYVVNGGKHYLVCQDGLAAGQTSAASGDRVPPKSLGLPAKGVWNEPGTAVYRWEGKQTNLVFVFMGTPQK